MNHQHHPHHGRDDGGNIDHWRAVKNTAATQNTRTGFIGRQRRGPRRIMSEDVSGELHELAMNVVEGNIIKPTSQARCNLTKHRTQSTPSLCRAIKKWQSVGFKGEPQP
jgi:hypothetical protein